VRHRLSHTLNPTDTRVAFKTIARYLLPVDYFRFRYHSTSASGVVRELTWQRNTDGATLAVAASDAVVLLSRKFVSPLKIMKKQRKTMKILLKIVFVYTFFSMMHSLKGFHFHTDDLMVRDHQRLRQE